MIDYVEEVWLPIPGYKGIYEISNMGRIVSFLKGKNHGRVLTPKKDHRGYLRIRIYQESKRVGFKIHRLVAEAFIPNPDNKPQVNHKNGIKTDNRASELEWCTREENLDHAFKSGLNTSVGIKIINTKTGEIYNSKTDLRRKTGMGWSKMNEIVENGRSDEYRKV